MSYQNVQKKFLVHRHFKLFMIIENLLKYVCHIIHIASYPVAILQYYSKKRGNKFSKIGYLTDPE